MACSTRSLVTSRTPPCPDATRETVAVETPARAATCAIVGALSASRLLSPAESAIIRDKPARPSRPVDALTAAAPAHGWTLLFPETHPHAGGESHYAAYLTNTDGFEAELVARETSE